MNAESMEVLDYMNDFNGISHASFGPIKCSHVANSISTSNLMRLEDGIHDKERDLELGDIFLPRDEVDFISYQRWNKISIGFLFGITVIDEIPKIISSPELAWMKCTDNVFDSDPNYWRDRQDCQPKYWCSLHVMIKYGLECLEFSFCSAPAGRRNGD
jgi:hypothetical protein